MIICLTTEFRDFGAGNGCKDRQELPEESSEAFTDIMAWAFLHVDLHNLLTDLSYSTQNRGRTVRIYLHISDKLAGSPKANVEKIYESTGSCSRLIVRRTESGQIRACVEGQISVNHLLTRLEAAECLLMHVRCKYCANELPAPVPSPSTCVSDEGAVQTSADCYPTESVLTRRLLGTHAN